MLSQLKTMQNEEVYFQKNTQKWQEIDAATSVFKRNFAAS